MKKRVIWKMLVLTIITLGIYRLYWFVKTRKEMMQLHKDVKIMSPVFLVIPVVLVIFALGIFVVESIRVNVNLPSYCHALTTTGQPSQAFPKECVASPALWPMLFFYVAILAFWPLIAVWLWGYSKAVEVVTHEKTSFAMAMIVLMLVPDGIDILIVQDMFNKLQPAKS